MASAASPRILLIAVRRSSTLETYELKYMVSLPMMHGDGLGPSSTCISFEQQGG